jgi:hypothetical protein
VSAAICTVVSACICVDVKFASCSVSKDDIWSLVSAVMTLVLMACKAAAVRLLS